MHGLLNINKPAGVSSRAAVNLVQGLVHPVKVGHAGTLDPIARGVLLVCVGWATRLVETLQRLPKRYTATFRLGCRSDTEDIEGEVHAIPDAEVPMRSALQKACVEHTGQILQQPPAFSALKVDGRRAYKRARKGAVDRLPARPAQIHRLAILEYDYPQLILDIECGSGTYVRSLGRDIAESVGSSAVMEDLTRTAIGSFAISDAIDVSSLDHAQLCEALLPPSRAVAHLPSIRLSAAGITEMRHGRAVELPRQVATQDAIAILDESDRLVALGFDKAGMLAPKRVFPADSAAH